MIGKMLSTGFSIASMPLRLTLRSARAMGLPAAEFTAFMNELRAASDEAVCEIQQLMFSVNDELERKTAHLSNEQKQQAALLALDAAEKHLSMAAVNILRAVWLAMNSSPALPSVPATRRSIPIDPADFV